MRCAELAPAVVIWSALVPTGARAQDATIGGVVKDTLVAVMGGIGVEASSPLLVNDAVSLHVQYVRFNTAEKMDGAPSTVLNFGLSNQGTDDLTRIVVKVSILKEAAGSGVSEPLAGPYTLVGNDAVVRPGQTLDFKMRLRNLSSDCDCVARVNVLSAHSTRSVGPDHDRGPAPSPKTPDDCRQIAATNVRRERQGSLSPALTN